MKRRIAFLICCVISFAFVLSGCDLFTVDNNRYLSQKIVTIQYLDSNDNKTLTVTKEDLIQAYNRYGKNLTESGYTQNDAIDYLVNYLIDKELMLNEVKNMIEDDTIFLYNADYNYMWEECYNGLLSLLASYEEQVIKDWGVPNATKLSDNEEETTENTEFEPYEQTAHIEEVDGNYVIKVNKEEKQVEELIYDEVGNEVDTLYDALIEEIGSDSILLEAQKRYVASLTAYEKGKNLSTDSTEVLKREIQRVYTNVEENRYLQLYAEVYEEKNGISPISVNDIFEYISSKMLASQQKYTVNPDSYSADMISTTERENVWYLMDNDYFSVTHILVKFSEDQTNQIKDLDEQLTKGLTPSQYNYLKQQIVNQTVVKENGVATDMTIQELYTQFANDMKNKTESEKVDVINHYVYTYNEDAGNKNKVYDYIIGTEKSSMVEEFNEASRELFDNGNGNFGDYSEYVESTYGLHIVIYLEPQTNLFTITEPNNFSLVTANKTELEQNIAKITTTQISKLNNRTVFDYVFDKLNQDNFEKFEKMQLSTLRDSSRVQLSIYNNNFSDLKA